MSAIDEFFEKPQACMVCNALIVVRNPTHYDPEDLAAAKVRGQIISKRLVEAELLYALYRLERMRKSSINSEPWTLRETDAVWAGARAAIVKAEGKP